MFYFVIRNCSKFKSGLNLNKFAFYSKDSRFLSYSFLYFVSPVRPICFQSGPVLFLCPKPTRPGSFQPMTTCSWPSSHLGAQPS
jgi:hypothetical protein